MNRVFIVIFLLALAASCATKPNAANTDDILEITEVSPDRQTALMKQNMFHLAQVYDLRPYLYTKKIYIQNGSKERSHPILTLDTKHADNPPLILSYWLHGEFHWLAVKKAPSMRNALADLKKIYPKNVLSDHVHLLICSLEYQALKVYLGEREATNVIRLKMRQDKIYPWVYAQVLNETESLLKVLRSHQIMPPQMLETDKKS